MLWKHKAPFHIYQILDVILGRCRAILTETIPNKVTQEAKDFLEGRGLLYIDEEHLYIKLFGFDGKHFLLPRFVIDRLFV